MALWDLAGMSKSFQTALVTGGASGIGAATVSLLEAEGCEVLSLDLATGFDVADAAAWEDIGPVDFAFLNAGVATGENDVAELSDAATGGRSARTSTASSSASRRMAQVMEPGSSIVATASLAGLMAMPLDPIYSLTKHAVVGFVRAAAPQLAGEGDHDQRALPELRRHADRRRTICATGSPPRAGR